MKIAVRALWTSFVVGFFLMVACHWIAEILMVKVYEYYAINRVFPLYRDFMENLYILHNYFLLIVPVILIAYLICDKIYKNKQSLFDFRPNG